MFSEQTRTKFFPHRGNFDHAIEFHPKTTPFFGFLYNFAKTEIKMYKNYIDTKFKSNFTKRSNNRTKAFILFVKKILRLCVDYKRLIAITIRNKYFIPLVSKNLDRLKRAKVYTKLNFKNVYNLIGVKKNPEWKTVFRTRYGLFKYYVMFFRLLNTLPRSNNILIESSTIG